MIYAIPDNRPFVLTSKPKTRREMSEEYAKREAFINSHYFTITYDDDKERPVVVVTKKDE